MKCDFCKKSIKKQDKSMQVNKKMCRKSEVFIHAECYSEFLKKEKDKIDFDNLCLYVKNEIYEESQLEIPPAFCTMAWDVRNGTLVVKGATKINKNTMRQGVPFDILLEAFQLVRDKIKRVSKDKMFATRGQKYKYGLAIARSYIDTVYTIRERQKNEELYRKREQQNVFMQETHRPNESVLDEYDKKLIKRSDDISDLLD